MLTSIRSASNAATSTGTVPTAASTRPQLGSLPNTAALNRLERVTARATATAASSVPAPTTVTAMSWLAPSASATSARASCAHASVTASASCSGVGRTPDAPDASSATVSFVDMHPSESTRSNVTRVAARRAASASPAVQSASVVSTQSMVARPGASIPAPLAMPPTDQPSRSTTTVFATESVVMIATAASCPPSGVRACAARVTPSSSRGMGRRSPIRPVEQTRTSPAEMPRAAAVCSAVACVSAKPSGPVQALAPPELSTTAPATPSDTACRVHRTGAACTRLLVSTAAPTASGPSLTTRATSGRPEALRPAVTPAARKPRGAVTVMGRLRSWSGRASPAARARG
jgi:hypothetical protein